MENDDLKAAGGPNRRLERHDTINLQLLREKKLERTRSTLRPLLWGGRGALFGASSCWRASCGCAHNCRDLPTGARRHRRQVYGIATVALAGETIRRIRASTSPHTGPRHQQQLAAAPHLHRQRHGRRPAVVVPVGADPPALAGLGGVDLHARARPRLGQPRHRCLGLLATAWFHRWSRNPQRPRLPRRWRTVTGGSLQARTDRRSERFERD